MRPTAQRLDADELPPLVIGSDELDGYGEARAAFAERVATGKGLTLRKQFKPRWLDGGSVVILGSEARREAVGNLFADRLEIWDGGFEVSPVRYVGSGDAMLACIRNPNLAGAVVCVFYANGDEALSQARLITFYGGNSLVIFEHGTPIQRRDFERTERLEVAIS